MRPITLLLTALLAATPLAVAQAPTPAAPMPDILIFTNGDQLTGKLVSAAGGSIVFASDMAGQLTIPFSKIKELRSGSSPAQFALLKNGVPVNPHTPAPEGTAEIAAGNVVIHPDTTAQNSSSSSTAASVPVAQVDYLVAKPDFDRQIAHHVGFFHAWTGAATGGATIVRSTQTGTTLTAALNLLRALPTVPWLLPRNRTSLNVAESYGKLSTPVIPQTVPPSPPAVVVTSIFHADAERDQYFSPRVYALGDVSFDHNFSQGLQLQQVYGGGIGWTALKSAKQELDLKADIHFERQQYITTAGVVPAPSVNLIGSTISEGYHRDLSHKLLFTQTANILPAFNIAADYSANFTAALAIPVFKRLSASISTTDNFLNDPSPGYNKNSFQFITGVSYAIH